MPHLFSAKDDPQAEAARLIWMRRESSTAAADTKHLTALAVMQNNQSGSALFSGSTSFDGITPNADDILLKFTYYGDADLNGKVDGSDYSRIDYGAIKHLTSWFNGDFNYDGIINGSDYTLIDNAFNVQGAQENAVISPTTELSTPASVPEPAGVPVMMAAILLRRRHRRCT